MKKSPVKSRKSLRSMLVLWLLSFSVVPLAFITGYSFMKFEQAINQELVERLRGNQREVDAILGDYQTELSTRNRRHAADKSLIYFMTSGRTEEARNLATDWMRGHLANSLRIYNREGRLEIYLYRDANGEIQRQEKLEGSAYYLSADFLRDVQAANQRYVMDFAEKGAADLVVFSPVRATNGAIVGYIEELIRLDPGFFNEIRRRLGVEVVVTSADGEKSVAGHDDLASYRKGFFLDQYKKFSQGLFELTIQTVPYGFSVAPAKWGDESFLVATGASKQLSKKVLETINVAFFTVVAVLAALLIVLSFVISRVLLGPLNELVEAVQTIDFESEPAPIKVRSETELGILIDSFNEMAMRVHTAQKDLKENIKMLEAANIEIRETQARLVHTEKMAGLGQLVAGVAHELNNPIGFIYSNMSHLRDYGSKLVELVKTAKTNPAALDKKMADLEFDYITNDMPKLIQSCEDGARRTRDIVLGLRSFSRLDEAKQKEVDIHEGIESTLALLAGELKAKVKIHKNYGSLPRVLCYPSQLNQVFMNILTNSIQAIPDSGEIFISTKELPPDQVEISIRDTGVGMSEDVRKKVFDPFFTTKDVSQGTGLGMSITYGIIQKHQGEIEVISAPGRGTEFRIRLPVRPKGRV